MKDDRKMQDLHSMASSLRSKRNLIEAGIGVVLLVLTFSAIALSDTSTIALHAYWVVLVVIFGAATFAANALYSPDKAMSGPVMLRILLHWVGVFCAIQFVYFFVSTGRVANVGTGLSNGVLMGLGAFLAGVHFNWRFMVIGAAAGLATVSVAFIEEYLWILFGIAVLAIVGLFVGARISKKLASA
jgi:hypothetical protein